MKITIGITQEPQQTVQSLFSTQNGSLTEVGPFLSRAEALDWLTYLKHRITDCEEIIPADQPETTIQAWYGFTFEAIDS